MKTVSVFVAVILLVLAARNSQFLGSSAESDTAINAIAPIGIPSNLAQSDEAGPEVKLVLLALLPEGFDMKDMQLEAGEYLFIVGNRTGLNEVNIRFERKGSERLAGGPVGGRKRDFKKRLKLTAGSYVITADDNPNWTCRIVVGF